jgi:Trypsin
MCGGAIISDKTILTASHCLFYIPDPLTTQWVLGMHSEIDMDGIVYNTKHYELHPKFINLSFYDDYDIALVTLAEKIQFSKTIKPICLPAPGDDFTGQAATVAGW